MIKRRKTAGKRESTLLVDERKSILSPNSNFFVREAYKTLRTNTMFSLAETEGCKVILVTSSLQSEGKSINTLNLAISFAEAENRVLLIDCDLRRPKLARLLRKSSPVGLSNLLLNPSLVEKAILPSDINGLDVILAGDIPPNPSELLGSARMGSLLDKLKEHYDYILLDTPPVNMVTDAVVLGSKSDGVLFVVRTNQSERDSVMRAVEQLEYAKIKILGFVMSDAAIGQSNYGYRKYGRYKKYGYYGGYGYGNHIQDPDADEKLDRS